MPSSGADGIASSGAVMKSDKLNEYVGALGSHLNAKRKGFFSVKDTEAIERNAKQREENIGSIAASFVALDKSNNPLKNGNVQIGNRMFATDENGILRMVDTEAVKEKLITKKERQSYVTSILPHLIVDDEITREILNLSKKDFTELFSASASDTILKKYDAEAFDKVNCLPSFIAMLEPTSLTYAQALAKLRCIVYKIMPVMDFVEPESAHGEARDDKAGMI